MTVASVELTGTAADRGIQKGDTIVEVQRTLVSEPDQALRIFWAQSLLTHRFAAVLVEHDKKRFWMSLAVPERKDCRDELSISESYFLAMQLVDP